MSTRARASAVFPQPLEQVWAVLRDFSFPKLIDDVESVEIDDGESAFAVGAVRTIKWKSGEVRKQRLVALSDLSFSISWELVFADPPEETTAYDSTIQLYRITENNSTFVSWTYEYSADVSQGLIQFRQAELARTLDELRSKIGH